MYKTLRLVRIHLLIRAQQRVLRFFLGMLFYTLEGLGEFLTVMQTRDVVSGLHNCQEFSQPLSANTENVFYCLISDDVININIIYICNLAKHYYVRNNRLHMQPYCHFNFFCLSLKTNDHLKYTLSSGRAFKFRLVQFMRILSRSLGLS